MLTKRIIPCLDVRAGRVVKGVRFANLRDAGDPVEQATRYEDEGADEITILDVSATTEARAASLETVASVRAALSIPLTVGGGLNSVDAIRQMLNAGADKISLNTAAVTHTDLVREASQKFGNQCIVVAVDAQKRPDGGDWEVYTHGGRRPTGRDAVSWAHEAAKLGAGEILLTSMDCDGTQAGYDLELTRAVAEAVPVPVIASGGAGELAHLVQVVQEGKANAVLAASIFHYGTYTLEEAKQTLRAAGLPVRL